MLLVPKEGSFGIDGPGRCSKTGSPGPGSYGEHVAKHFTSCLSSWRKISPERPGTQRCQDTKLEGEESLPETLDRWGLGGGGVPRWEASRHRSPVARTRRHRDQTAPGSVRKCPGMPSPCPPLGVQMHSLASEARQREAGPRAGGGTPAPHALFSGLFLLLPRGHRGGEDLH